MVSSELWFGAEAGFYNGVATQSLRFDDGSSAFLSRTPSSTTNEKTFTFSCWAKRGTLGNSHSMFSFYDSSSDYGYMRFSADGTLRTSGLGGGSLVWSLISDALHRDVSAWYHVVFAFDTTQSTSSNRIKMYINGTQITSFSTNTYPSQDLNTGFNDTYEHRIGLRTTGSMQYDGYLSEVNFVDGLALDPTYFGETKNGVWIPIEYTGSYGTNGFRLQFNQTGVGTASTSTIGADTSGNTHHFTSSGIVASDCNMPDSPENNFATLNPLGKLSASALSEGNLKAVITSGTNSGRTPSTFAVSSGKWYWEVRQSSANRFAMGVFDTENYVMANEDAGTDAYEWAWLTDGGGSNKGILFNNASSLDYGNEVANGEIIMVALDADNNAIWFGKENSWFNRDGSSSSATVKAQIEAGTTTNAGHSSVTGNLTPVFVRQTSTDTLIVNYGQDSSFAGNETAQGNTDGNGKGDFAYAPPSGFLALCSANLPEPTISPNANTQADDYFNTVLYTGNSSTQSITGVGFQPDWLWIKSRNQTHYHGLFDSNRGSTKRLFANETDAESTQSAGVTSFDSDGFSLGSNAGQNQTAKTYVGWNWKANGGTTSSVDAGSGSNISNGTANHATVQANQDAGFSIVTTTLTVRSTAVATIPHGLGSTPHFIIAKQYDTANIWSIYHQDIPSNSLMLGGSYGDDPANSGSNFSSVGGTTFGHQTNSISNNANENHIFYCFKEIAGYSRFGSYVGNGSNDGTFVHLGFRPAFIMIKRTNSTGNWVIQDSVRQTFNPSDAWLRPNTSDAEGTTSPDLDLDFVSNGFKIRNNGTDNNISNSTYIYMAFAEAPFKYANAR